MNIYSTSPRRALPAFTEQIFLFSSFPKFCLISYEVLKIVSCLQTQYTLSSISYEIR